MNGQDARSTLDKFYVGGTGILPVANELIHNMILFIININLIFKLFTYVL